MHEKKACKLALEEIEKRFTTEKGHVDSEKLDAKMSLKVFTHEERIQEAGKPLYLRRYE